jgi:membrane protein
VLLGAVIAAYLPSLLAGAVRPGSAPGWQFQLALEVLQELNGRRNKALRGRTASSLAQALEVDVLRLEPALEALIGLSWIGQLATENGEEPCFVLLAEPERTPLEPLIQRLLLTRSPSLENLWKKLACPSVSLADAL